ncbi:family 78 glycoside hydrolase catalytic domain [Kribbella sp. NPDC050124]|uniref:family 78 glycoside hydrolase catalytic domain n=1 Tax=Kribbella sp. NPDC050124 TaxID=3364114 RepID=UPI00378DBCD1
MMMSSPLDLRVRQVWPVEEPPGWRANWIGPSVAEGATNVAFLCRHAFRLGSSRPRRSVLHIGAESSYLLYVNGALAGRGPVRGTAAVTYFDTYDVTELLQDGENWIAIAAHSPNTPTFQASPQAPAVIAQLDDGDDVATDARWQVCLMPGWRPDVEMYTFQIGFTEWQNHADLAPSWSVGGDVAAGWTAAAAVRIDKDLFPRDIPFLTDQRVRPSAVRTVFSVPAEDGQASIAGNLATEPHSNLSLPGVSGLLQEPSRSIELERPPAAGGVGLIIDFGEIVNGAVEIAVTAPRGTVLDLGYDEQLNRNRRLSTAAGDYRFADRHILSGSRQTVTGIFGRRGFRLVELVFRDAAGPVTLHEVRAVQRRFPYVDRAAFSCTDARLNQVWNACVETLKSCATDVFVDCPWRENALWLTDVPVESLSALQAFGDGRLTERCLRLLFSQVRDDGLVPAVAPAGDVPALGDVRPPDWLVLPAANLYVTFILEDFLLYTGSSEFVVGFLPKIDAILDTFRSWVGPDHVILPPDRHWNLIDWSYEFVDRSTHSARKHAALDYMFVLALRSAARLHEQVGDSDRVASLSEEARVRWTQLRAVYWDDARSLFADLPAAGQGTSVDRRSG